MPYLLHISYTALAATLQSLAVLDFKLDSIQLRTIQWDNFPKQILCSPLYVAIFLYMATVTEKSWRTLENNTQTKRMIIMCIVK